MTKDEALRLALEAMEEIIHWYAVRDKNDVFLNFVDQNFEIQKIMKSITAIKEALETKQWVGLTDKEIEKIWLETLINNTEQIYLKDFAYSIEAKLKEKNYVKN